jgi:hypothetical protein
MAALSDYVTKFLVDLGRKTLNLPDSVPQGGPASFSRAEGGRVQPYLVGDAGTNINPRPELFVSGTPGVPSRLIGKRGPTLFVPPTPGRIIPNKDLSRQEGGEAKPLSFFRPSKFEPISRQGGGPVNPLLIGRDQTSPLMIGANQPMPSVIGGDQGIANQPYSTSPYLAPIGKASWQGSPFQGSPLSPFRKERKIPSGFATIWHPLSSFRSERPIGRKGRKADVELSTLADVYDRYERALSSPNITSGYEQSDVNEPIAMEGGGEVQPNRKLLLPTTRTTMNPSQLQLLAPSQPYPVPRIPLGPDPDSYYQNPVDYARGIDPRTFPIRMKEGGEVVPLEENGGVWAIARKDGGDVNPFDPYVQEASKKYGVEPERIYRMIQQESSNIPTAVGGKGERGLMQLRPSTATDVAKGTEWEGKPLESYINEPRANIHLGTKYWSQLKDQFGGDPIKAHSAYNWGSKNVQDAITAGTPFPQSVSD